VRSAASDPALPVRRPLDGGKSIGADASPIAVLGGGFAGSALLLSAVGVRRAGLRCRLRRDRLALALGNGDERVWTRVSRMGIVAIGLVLGFAGLAVLRRAHRGERP
jgi:hypothetical protein